MLKYLRKIWSGKKWTIEADGVEPIVSTPLKDALAEDKRKKPKIKSEKYRAVGRLPKEGYTWNPFLGYPRNHTCICTSGKKFKACCLGLMERVVTVDNARFVQANWEGFLNGRFTTKDVKPN
jgi:SEC-C motif